MVAWVPLESDPEILTEYAHKLGLAPGFEFVDVISFEPEVMEAVVPEISQAKAVIFLFPMTSKRSVPPANSTARAADLFFMKQTIDNACGSIALMHSLANNPGLVVDGSILGSFMQRTANMLPTCLGIALEDDSMIRQIHASFALQGQTDAPDAAADIDLHFVAFVASHGKLYELDGQREGPVEYGLVDEQAEFFKACCDAIKSTMNIEEAANISAMALVPRPAEST